jgi:hypothetical protein
MDFIMVSVVGDFPDGVLGIPETPPDCMKKHETSSDNVSAVSKTFHGGKKCEFIKLYNCCSGITVEVILKNYVYRKP